MKTKYIIHTYTSEEAFRTALYEFRDIMDIRLPQGMPVSEEYSAFVPLKLHPFRKILWTGVFFMILVLSLQIWAAAFAYPLIFGGKDPFNPIVYIPFAFEMFIFFTAVISLIYALTRLKKYPVDWNDSLFYIIRQSR